MKVPKFIQDQIDELKQLKSGISNHTALWNNQPVTIPQIDAAIAALEKQAADLNTAEETVTKMHHAAHDLVNKTEPLVKQTTKLAEALHHNTPIDLVDYGIDPAKQKTPLGTPGKAIIASIKDDADGVGFAFVFQSLTDALGFDVERAIAPSADVLSVDPATFTHIETVYKLSFVDNNVVKGKRYFYRIRGVNRTSKGEWSAIVSRIQ